MDTLQCTVTRVWCFTLFSALAVVQCYNDAKASLWLKVITTKFSTKVAIG